MQNIARNDRNEWDIAMKLGKLTETSVRVLSLDTLSPVLREEHVGRESTLGGLGILLGFASPRGFFNLFSSLALD